MITIFQSNIFYGNRATKVLHTGARRDACRLEEIKKENRVRFKKISEAIGAGYRKCKLCFRELKKKDG